MMAKTSSPARHFLMSVVFVTGDTEVSELEIDEGVGGNGQQGYQANDKGIARNADGVWAAFPCKATEGCEINGEQDDDSHKI